MSDANTAITKLTDAVRMLSEVRTVSDAAKLVGLAEAARVYAQTAHLGMEAQNYGAEIKLRAERLGGAILVESEMNTGGRPAETPAGAGSGFVTPTLKEMGISWKQSSRWQTIARIPEPVFEREIATVKAQNNELTTAGMLRLAQGKDTHQLISQSNSNEWYTPPEYIEAARTVLGAIDLDPASNEFAQTWIKATAYYSADDDGLAHEWRGRVWLNPPWGRLTADFIEKLAEEIAAGRVTEAVVLVNAHATDTEWFSPLWDGLLCFTDHRINYVSPDEVSSGSTHGSVFVYLGPKEQEFAATFARWGAVVRRVCYADQE